MSKYIKLDDLKKMFPKRSQRISNCFNSRNCHRTYDDRVTSCEGCDRFYDYNEAIMEIVNSIPVLELKDVDIDFLNCHKDFIDRIKNKDHIKGGLIETQCPNCAPRFKEAGDE